MLGVKDVDNYIKRQQRILITNAMRTNCQANRRVTMTSQSKAKKSTASRAGSKSRAAKTPAAKPATPARAARFRPKYCAELLDILLAH